MTNLVRRSSGIMLTLVIGLTTLGVADLGAAAATPAGDPLATAPASVAPEVDAAVTNGEVADVLIELTPDGRQPSLDDDDAAARDERADDLAARTDLGEVRALSSDQPLVVAGVDAAQLDALRTSPDVVSVRPNRRHTVDLASSTATIGAPTAWAGGWDGSGYRIAILDTGVDSDHPFLNGQVTSEACFSGGSSLGGVQGVCPGANPTFAIGAGAAPPCDHDDFVPADNCSHGTHVSGIAAGVDGPTSAPSGVAPGAEIIAVQVFSLIFSTALCGGGNSPCATAFDADLIEALDWVRAQQLLSGDIAAANMSLGGGLFTGACGSDPLAPGIDALLAAGTPTAVASGNDYSKSSMSSPGCVPSAVTVGSMNDANMSVSDFSNSSAMLDLLAPGESIRSSVTGTGYDTWDGTSMATPHVAGAMAVLRERRGAITTAQMQLILNLSGQSITDTANGRVTKMIRVDRAVSDISPFGSTEGSASGVGQVSVSGWAIDPDTNSPISVEVRVDGVLETTTTANLARSDVGAAYPGYGNNHGFAATVTGLDPGMHQICVTALNTSGALGSPTAASASIGCRQQSVGDLFTPLSPVRILDSRPATQVGPYNTKWSLGTTRDVTVAGTAGVPADATAVVLNTTVTNTTGASNLVVWPKGETKPVASSLNWSPGWTIANAVTVKVGEEGKISVYNNVGTTDVVIDVVGYYRLVDGAGYTPITPIRVQDSRPATRVGPYSSPWAQTTTRDVTVAGTAGVPADATAVVLNTTVTNTTGASNLVVWPKNETKPVASNLNWSPGWTIPNAVTVKVGTDRKISVYNNVGSADVVVDIVGYFRPGAGNAFHPITPVRAQDSRPSTQVGPHSSPWGAGTTRDVKPAGAFGVPASAAAVLLNVTVTNTTGSSNLVVWPKGQTKPTASSLNWVPGWTIPNAVTVKMGTDGKASFYNNAGSADVIADIAGWYG